MNYDFVVEGDQDYELVLDFDAAESIRQAGGEYLLEPVLTVASFGPVEGGGEDEETAE